MYSLLRRGELPHPGENRWGEIAIIDNYNVGVNCSAMTTTAPLKSGLTTEGLTLGQAALIAGFAYLLSPVCNR
jgi:hypothetical protein